MNTYNLLGRLRLPQKFLILAFIGLVLASIPCYLYLSESNKLLAALTSEQAGLVPIAKGLSTVQLTQQHRAMSALMLGGAENGAEKRAAKQAEADKAYAELEAIVKTIGAKSISEQWDVVWRDWQTLRGNVANRAITSGQSYAAHSALVPKIIRLSEAIGDHYALSLDPDRDSYQLIQAMYYQLPYLTEELGRLRARGTALLTKKSATPDERLDMQGTISRVHDRLDQTLNAFNKATAENPAFDASLKAAMKQAADAATSIAEAANNEIIKTEQFSYSPEQWVTLSTKAIDAQFAANAAAGKELAKAFEDKIAAFKYTRWTMIAAMLGIVTVAGYIAFLITRSVTVPLNHAVEMAQSVASGNLANEFDVGPDNEVGQLLRALRTMNDSLRQMVINVRQSADSISAATHDIASGNADVSARIESQASNLQETAASMEELTSTVQQNAEHTRQTNDLVQNASAVAGKGGNIVSRVVQTMGEINESSRKIVDIISVIDSIAFQTNILALNAAVEAARAGEQGRGFAVVAGEVRTLAQRSATAAKEIKELINNSVEKVETGNQLAAEAGTAMSEVLDSVKGITEIVSEIASASTEQRLGIEQINQAVTQMDDMTQQNAALVEQMAAASASLEEQAQLLVQEMHIFKVGDEPGSARPLSAPKGGAFKGSRQLAIGSAV